MVISYHYPATPALKFSEVRTTNYLINQLGYLQTADFLKIRDQHITVHYDIEKKNSYLNFNFDQLAN